jgi:hypothetical protein
MDVTYPSFGIRYRRRQKMERYVDAELFNYKCPYTDEHCDDWACEVCEVEEEERRWMEEMEAEDESNN